MASAKSAKLPARSDMLRRLRKVSDDSHLVEYLYPSILKYAGEKRTGDGVITMLLLALRSYGKSGSPHLVISVLRDRIPDYVKALIDDKEVRNDALEHARRIGL